MKNRTITSNEFISLFILSKLFTLITFHKQSGNTQTFMDDILLTLCTSFILLVFCAFYYFLTKDHHSDLLTAFTFKFVPFRQLNFLLLFLYSVYVAATSSVQFLDFTVEAVYQKGDFMPLAVLFVCLLAYSMVSGFSPLAKTSVVVFALFVIFTVYLTIVLFPQLQLVNLKSEVSLSALDFLKTGAFNFTQNFELILLLIFIKETKPIKKVYTRWVFYSLGLILLLNVLLQLSMGAMLNAQSYPYYTLSILSSNMSAFRRLDALFIVLWVFVSFVRIAFIGLCAKETLLALLNKRQTEKSVNLVSIVTAVFIFVGIVLIHFNKQWLGAINEINAVLFVYFFVLSLITLLYIRSKGEKGEKNEKSN